MYLTTSCYDINFYFTTILLHMIQSVTNILVSASTNVITSAMQYLKLFSLDEGGSRLLQNICPSVPDYTAATSVPLYQTTPLPHLSLCTRLHCHHKSLCTRLHYQNICPSVPDYTAIISPSVPDYTTNTSVPLYQTTLPS
jgi:hypothetical protein